MFTYPATELFKAGGRRVVWSQEEFDAAIAAGWSAERPAGEAAAEEAPAAPAATAPKPPKQSKA